MVAIRIDSFGGMVPRVSDRLLADSNASSARNCRLLSGELRGMRAPTLLHRFTTGTVGNVLRAVRDDGSFQWIPFTSKDSSFAKGPLINDLYDRYYFVDTAGYLEYNTLDRFAANLPAYKVGVPAPPDRTSSEYFWG